MSTNTHPIVEESATRDDAKLFAELAANEAALDASRKADREAAIAVAGPVPDGWAFAKAVRDPFTLTKAQRRAGVPVPVSGWIAERPANRQWLFGVREGMEQIRSGSPGVSFVESFSSQEANRKRLEAEIAGSRKEITRRFDDSIAEWVADYETAFLPDGRPFARRNLTGADGWLPWQLIA